ncbi:serine/threonine-protein kinase [Plantactinospora soyae]|uniref:non-specific serine/threonine protein kinase n=1 Tax=Plantactinospora soyae TaxID=1544732 RepID=A0A927R004_9ACTN|nr:serine/threonine-protein kinase [Plantactinospora soyae]MBE1489647.1 hypothetical protein [Plantactinospora soyae]
MKDDLLAGRYRPLRLIADTAHPGRVWLARDEVLGRHVAVKKVVVPERLSAAERSRLHDRTLGEVRGLAGIDNPGVVSMWDVLSADDHLWLVMEHVPARSLSDVIAANGPLTAAEVVRVGLHLLGALDVVHAAGVVHRDVRPRNVLLADDGRVVLGGFGLPIFDSGAPAAVAGRNLSTTQYIAPERAHDATSTPATDLWGLGATLYVAAEGRLPWARPTILATLAALATEPPDPMYAHILEPTVTGLLRRNPRQRLTTEEARSHLETLTVSTVATAPSAALSRTHGRWPVTATPTKRGTVYAPGSAPVTSGNDAGNTKVLTVAMPPARGRTGWAFAAAMLGLLAVGAVVVAAAGTLVAGLGDQTGETARTPAAAAAGPAETAEPAEPAQPAHPCLDDTAATEGEPVLPATSPPPQALPDGWLWHQDPNGFSIAVPADWTRSTNGKTVCFRDPDELRLIAVDPTAKAAATPQTRWQAEERELLRAGALPGYKKISIGPVIRPGGAAEWEYTWNHGDGQPLHALRLLGNQSPTRAYSLSWITPDSQWALNEPNQRLLSASFRLE